MRHPRLTLDMLAAVIALVEQKTMEAAADQLGVVTPSAVQKRIQAASRLIGAPLFMSTENGMMPTKTGETLYAGAQRALESALLAEDRTLSLLDLEAGRLRVGHSTYLPPRLISLIHRINFDESETVRIEHLPGLTTTTVTRVLNGTLHAGFGALPVVHPDLHCHVLYEEAVVVCMSSSHPLAIKPVIRPQDLEGVPTIAVAREPLPWMHAQVEEFFAGFGIKLRVAADAFSSIEAVAMAEQRIGLCFVAGSAVSRQGVVTKQLSPRLLSRKSVLFVR